MANKENSESDNKHTFYGISLPSDVTEGKFWSKFDF